MEKCAGRHVGQFRLERERALEMIARIKSEQQVTREVARKLDAADVGRLIGHVERGMADGVAVGTGVAIKRAEVMRAEYRFHQPQRQQQGAYGDYRRLV